MTAAIPIPPRVLALLGALLLVAVAFLVLRPVLLSGEDSTSATPAPIGAPPSSGAPARVTPKMPAAPARPRIELSPGLPDLVASKLLHSRVVVVAVYSGTSGSDRAAVGEARRGARTVGANFAALNVLDEQRAREVRVFVGDVDVPAVLVVRRPGNVVTRLEGAQDEHLIAQAALNAGARRR